MRKLKYFAAIPLAAMAALAMAAPASAYEMTILDAPDAQARTLLVGNYDRAIRYLERETKRISPYSAIHLTNLCTAYIATRQFEEAADTCDRAVAARGDYVGTAYNSRGVLRALQGDFVAALIDFEEATNAANYPHPNAPGPYYNVGDRTVAINHKQHEIGDNAMHIAAANLNSADRRWAAIKKESETLAAGVSE